MQNRSICLQRPPSFKQIIYKVIICYQEMTKSEAVLDPALIVLQFAEDSALLATAIAKA